jgi:hypothetical protein
LRNLAFFARTCLGIREKIPAGAMLGHKIGR